MRTGPSLTDMNNKMIAFEFQRAIKRGEAKLAHAIMIANPQIPFIDFVDYRALVEISMEEQP